MEIGQSLKIVVGVEVAADAVGMRTLVAGLVSNLDENDPKVGPTDPQERDDVADEEKQIVVVQRRQDGVVAVVEQDCSDV